MASKANGFQVKSGSKRKSPTVKSVHINASKVQPVRPMQTRNQNLPADEAKNQNLKKVQKIGFPTPGVQLKPLSARIKSINLENKLEYPQIKPINHQSRPLNCDSKPIMSEHKPIVSQIKQFYPEIKPLNTQIKPLIPENKTIMNSQFKLINSEDKQVNHQMKQINHPIKPINHQIKPLIPPIKPSNSQMKPLNPQIKPFNSQIVEKKSPGKQQMSRKIRNSVSQLQKRSFISDQEMVDMLEGAQIDSNNNVRGSQESLNTAGSACLVHIAKVYAAQQNAFDKLDGSRLVEDVLLRGKFWRDALNHAEACKDSINVYGLKVTFHCPSTTDMSKKRFFACIHLHNALRNFGIRSALAVHIDISRIKHRKVAEIVRRIIQLVGDGYNFFAYQFKVTQTQDAMRKLFNEPGAYGVYMGFAFILDYLAYRNKCKKANLPVEYDIKKYVEVLGDEGYVVRGIDKSSGSAQFEFETGQEFEDLNMEYVEILFNGVRFT